MAAPVSNIRETVGVISSWEGKDLDAADICALKVAVLFLRMGQKAMDSMAVPDADAAVIGAAKTLAMQVFEHERGEELREGVIFLFRDLIERGTVGGKIKEVADHVKNMSDEELVKAGMAVPDNGSDE